MHKGSNSMVIVCYNVEKMRKHEQFEMRRRALSLSLSLSLSLVTVCLALLKQLPCVWNLKKKVLLLGQVMNFGISV